MLQNLLDIEIAYSMLDCKDGDAKKGEDPLDIHYSKLKTDLTVSLEKWVGLRKRGCG